MGHILEASFSWRHFNAQDVERHIFSMQSLQKLDISHNIIERPPRLPQSLVVLNLSFNSRCENLAGLSASNLGNLRVLILTNNNLSSVKGLLSLPCLEKLDVSHNRLSTLSGLEFVPQLKVLLVQSNNIKKMTSLRCLSCSNALEVLDLRGNPVCDSSDYSTIKNFVVSTLGILDGRRYKARAFAPQHVAHALAISESSTFIQSSSKAITSIEQRASPEKALLDARQARRRTASASPTRRRSLSANGTGAGAGAGTSTPGRVYGSGTANSSSYLEPPALLKEDKSAGAGVGVGVERPVTGYTAQYLNSSRGPNRPKSSEHSSLLHQGLASQLSFCQSSPISKSGYGSTFVAQSANSSFSSPSADRPDDKYLEQDGAVFNGNGIPRSGMFRSAIHKPGKLGKKAAAAAAAAAGASPTHPHSGRRGSSRFDDLYVGDDTDVQQRINSHRTGANARATQSAGKSSGVNAAKREARAGTTATANTTNTAPSKRGGSVPSRRASASSGGSTPRTSVSYYYDVDTVHHEAIESRAGRARANQSVLSTPADIIDSSPHKSPIPWRNAPTIKPRPWRGLHWNEDWEESTKWVPQTRHADEEFFNSSDWIGGKTIDAFQKFDKNVSNKNELKMRLHRESLQQFQQLQQQQQKAPTSPPSQTERARMLHQGSSPNKRQQRLSANAGASPSDVFGFGGDSGFDLFAIAGNNSAGTPLVSSNGRVYKESLWIANGSGIIGIPSSPTSKASVESLSRQQQQQQQQRAMDDFDSSRLSAEAALSTSSYRFSDNYRNALTSHTGERSTDAQVPTTDDPEQELDISQLTIGSSQAPNSAGVRLAQEYFYSVDDEILLPEGEGEGEEDGSVDGRVVRGGGEQKYATSKSATSSGSIVSSGAASRGSKASSGEGKHHFAQPTFAHAMHHSPLSSKDPLFVQASSGDDARSGMRGHQGRSTSPPRAKPNAGAAASGTRTPQGHTSTAASANLHIAVSRSEKANFSEAAELSRSSEFEYSIDESASVDSSPENVFFAHNVVEPDLSVSGSSSSSQIFGSGSFPAAATASAASQAQAALSAPYNSHGTSGSDSALARKYPLEQLSPTRAANLRTGGGGGGGGGGGLKLGAAAGGADSEGSNLSDGDVNIVLEQLRRQKEQAFALLQAKLEKFTY